MVISFQEEMRKFSIPVFPRKPNAELNLKRAGPKFRARSFVDLHDEARPEGPGIVTLGPVEECRVLASCIADLRSADWFFQY
jgi:hypothetical protein